MTKYSTSYDIIVVGAGPAGSATAKTAAEHGAKVALLEEHEAVGVPLYCAEAIGAKGIREAGLEPVYPIISQKINKIQIFTPNGKSVTLTGEKADGYNLNREAFDKLLAENAVKAGADLLLKTRALRVIKEDGIVVGVIVEQEGKEYEMYGKLVVGSDGHHSIIRRSAGLKRYFDEYGSCAQYTLGGLDLKEPDTNEVYIGSNYAPGAYAWVFPKSREVANVGLGVRKIHTKPAIEYLKEFVANDPRFRNAEILKIGGGICPATGTLDKIVDDGLILVGDSAGQLIPLSGSGIHAGTVAGKIAGKVAAQAVKENDVSAERLQEYVTLFDQNWGKNIRESRKMLEIIGKFSDADFNKMESIINQDDVYNLVQGRNVLRTLIKIALRSPMNAFKFFAYLYN